ncbi:hypothetical protein [Paenibacillus eucommiae]|uniref:Uncharacterized protein n=1 Tax=Paenibacillus eucommiae TaxID=1355755 RepID=A0ABS4ITB3_9BACL|nr:hypothetical protein [Paenibacillus eucommiae]MBP1990810.1 hypothetical protein [Paenibacillus eucommiae]
MNFYTEIMNRKFSDVITQEQFAWLNEIVFLSALEEVWGSIDLAHRVEGGGPYPEQFDLLNKIFGMSHKEFDERIEAFGQHRKKKKERNSKDEK